MTRITADLPITKSAQLIAELQANQAKLLDALTLAVDTLDWARDLYFENARTVSEQTRALLKEFGR